MARAISDALRPVEDQSLNTAIADRLKDYILSERLRPGDKLPTEGALSERLHVSRSAVREAMRGLEALGMVEARQGSGRVVRQFSFDAIMDSLSYGMVFNSHTIRQVTEVRKALDAYFIELAAARATDEDLDELDALVERIDQKLREGKTYAEADYCFHRKLFEIAGNPLGMQLFGITWEVRMRTVDPGFWRLPGTTSEVDIHADIVSALRARDPGRARLAVLAHYAYSDEKLARQAAAESEGEPANGAGSNGSKRHGA